MCNVRQRGSNAYGDGRLKAEECGCVPESDTDG
jgi:hypothetical protein